MAFLAPRPKFQAFDSNGDPLASGTVDTYEPGTTTPKATYTDQGQGTANANPVVLDSRGEADIWLDGSYKLVLKDSAGTTIWTVDNINSLEDLYETTTKTGAYTVLTTDNHKLIKCDATSAAFTITLLAAATAGDGFEVFIKKIDSSSNAITIDGDGSETIDGQTTRNLADQYDALRIMSDGSNWQVLAGTVGTQLFKDENGNNILKFTATASAVNYFEMVNAATGNMPKLQAEGEADTGLIIANRDGEEIVIFDSIASSVNEFTIKSAATGNNPSIEASGDDTNIGIEFTAKGSGGVQSNNQFTVSTSDSRTNTAAYPIVLDGATTGTPANSIGVGIQFKAESADEAPSEFGEIVCVGQDVTAGSEATEFHFRDRTAGAAVTTSYRLRNLGAGSFTITGSPTAQRTITLADENITLSVSTQAEMEAATSTADFVTPGRTQYHPGVAKGWAQIDQVTTTTITGSHNVSSVVDNGTGDCTTNWDTNFSDATYAIVGMGTSPSGNNSVTLISIAAGSCRTLSETSSDGTDIDLPFHIAAFGDQ